MQKQRIGASEWLIESEVLAPQEEGRPRGALAALNGFLRSKRASRRRLVHHSVIGVTSSR